MELHPLGSGPPKRMMGSRTVFEGIMQPYWGDVYQTTDPQM